MGLFSSSSPDLHIISWPSSCLTSCHHAPRQPNCSIDNEAQGRARLPITGLPADTRLLLRSPLRSNRCPISLAHTEFDRGPGGSHLPTEVLTALTPQKLDDIGPPVTIRKRYILGTFDHRRSAVGWREPSDRDHVPSANGSRSGCCKGSFPQLQHGAVDTVRRGDGIDNAANLWTYTSRRLPRLACGRFLCLGRRGTPPFFYLERLSVANAALDVLYSSDSACL